MTSRLRERACLLPLPVCLGLMLLLVAPPATQAQQVDRLVLSEVLYDVAGTDDQLEWVELFNGHSTSVDLCHYSLAWAGSSYAEANERLSGVVPSGGYFVIGGPQSTAANGSPSLDLAQDFDPDLQNSGDTADAVALFESLPETITPTSIPFDAVIYGGINANLLIDEQGLPSDVDVGDAPAGSSIVRNDASAWQIAATPTPGSGTLVAAGGPGLDTPCPPPEPDEIDAVPFGELVAPDRVDFADLPAPTVVGDPAGHLEGVLPRAGLRLGERLTGQSIVRAVDWDVIEGTPTLPLDVLAGAEGANLYLLNRPPSAPTARILFGLTEDEFGFGSPLRGAISVRFDVDQGEVGLELFTYADAELLASFYARDGTLLGRETISIPDPPELDTLVEVGFRDRDPVGRIAAATLEWRSVGDGSGPGLRALVFDAPAPVPSLYGIPVLGLTAFLVLVGARAERASARRAHGIPPD